MKSLLTTGMGRWEISISEILAEVVGELGACQTGRVCVCVYWPAVVSRTDRKTVSLWGMVSDRPA